MKKEYFCKSCKVFHRKGNKTYTKHLKHETDLTREEVERQFFLNVFGK